MSTTQKPFPTRALADGLKIIGVRRGRLSITTSVLMGADLSNLCVQRRPGDVRTCRVEDAPLVLMSMRRLAHAGSSPSTVAAFPAQREGV